MSTQPQTPPPPVTVEEFLAWAEGRPGRFELIGGEIVAQASERAKHWEIKLATHVALLNAVKAKRVSCHVVPDGATVRIDSGTAYKPDAMIYCGSKVDPNAMIVENPIVIVEILSPTTGRNEKSRELADYFRLPSVAHYLIVDPDQSLIIHHQRRDGGEILTRIVREGTITLEPPGIELALEEIHM
jgi:Uma2 family endonuclease